MENEKKYNTGEHINIDTLTKEEKNIAIKEWAEGNPMLETVITTCNQNEIPTYESCNGHGLLGLPYISMIITKQNIEKIL